MTRLFSIKPSLTLKGREGRGLRLLGTGGRAWTDDLQPAFRVKRDTRRFGASLTGTWL
jgi:hypothetical protein